MLICQKSTFVKIGSVSNLRFSTNCVTLTNGLMRENVIVKSTTKSTKISWGTRG